MMDAGPAGGEGRRRGKKNRGRQSRRRRSKGRMHQSYQHFREEQVITGTQLDDRSILGGRQIRSPDHKLIEEDGPPDAFVLFSAYYLGITSSDGYNKPQLEDVARRFRMKPQEIKDLLVEFGLDEDTIRRTQFDLKGAQLDIRVAPEGISRTEIARDHFQDFMDARKEMAS